MRPFKWLSGFVGFALVSGACASTPIHGPAETQTVTLLFAADLHAQLEPHPELFWRAGQPERITLAGGFARLAAAIAEFRATRPGQVLAIDGGDTFQGSGVAAHTKGQAVIGPLTRIGFDVAVPGNWEVVYGADAMRSLTNALPWPTLAANVFDGAGERVFAPARIFRRGGVAIGVVGYTDPDVPLRQPPSYSAGLRFGGPEELSALAHSLRREGADVVILVSHIGLSRAVALTSQLSGFDLHLSADTHERTYHPIDVGGVWVVEPGAFGSFLGELVIEVRDGQLVDKRWQLHELTERAFPREDPATHAAVEDALAPWRAALGAELGSFGATFTRYEVIETSLDLLLADALRAATGTDIALSNGFRFGTPIMPGPVREADLWNMYPVVTRLKTGKVTGQQLLDFWEREIENALSPEPLARFGGWLPRPSGMRVVFSAKAPKGHRVTSLEVAGAPVDKDRVYTLTACEREGERPDVLCRIPGVVDPVVHEIDAHEAVRRYLLAHPEVSPPKGGRVMASDLARPMRSQAFELELDHAH